LDLDIHVVVGLEEVDGLFRQHVIILLLVHVFLVDKMLANIVDEMEV